MLAVAGDPATKQALRDNGVAAARRGIFGAPSFVTASGELFFGQDRLDQAIRWHLRGG